MTFGELIATRGRALKKHDYEFLLGDDGLAHLVIIVDITGSTDRPTFSLFCPCGAITGGNAEKREIAPGVTCLECGRR